MHSLGKVCNYNYMAHKTARRQSDIWHQSVDATMVIVVAISFFLGLWLVAHTFFR